MKRTVYYRRVTDEELSAEATLKHVERYREKLIRNWGAEVYAERLEALKQYIKGKESKGKQMRKTIQTLIDQTKTTIAFKQKWAEEHPGDINHMKLHFLDGRLEALEEVLNLLKPAPEQKPDSDNSKEPK